MLLSSHGVGDQGWVGLLAYQVRVIDQVSPKSICLVCHTKCKMEVPVLLLQNDTKTNLMYKIYFSPHTHTLTELPNFFLVGIHTKPYDAFSEINALSKVYDEAASYFKTESGIILGDFNADCRYLSMASYCDLSLVTDRRFTWSLHPMDTTTTSTICAYDRYL